MGWMLRCFVVLNFLFFSCSDSCEKQPISARGVRFESDVLSRTMK